MSSDRSPVTWGRSVAEYPLLHGHPPTQNPGCSYQMSAPGGPVIPLTRKGVSAVVWNDFRCSWDQCRGGGGGGGSEYKNGVFSRHHVVQAATKAPHRSSPHLQKAVWRHEGGLRAWPPWVCLPYRFGAKAGSWTSGGGGGHREDTGFELLHFGVAHVLPGPIIVLRPGDCNALMGNDSVRHGPLCPAMGNTDAVPLAIKTRKPLFCAANNGLIPRGHLKYCEVSRLRQLILV